MKALSVVCALSGALTLAGCALGGPAYAPPAPGVDAVVDMTTLMTFTPAQVTVRRGGTVEWKNPSAMGHTVTADPALARTPVALPPGASPFHSGNVPPGGVWRYTFMVPGRYEYVCLPHEGQGMRGVVNVTP